MLDTTTKRKINDARDILVGKVPVPSSQVEQITIALIYKFMYDMDNESIELGGNPKYFTGDFAQYAWNKLFDPKLSGEGRIQLYQDALAKIPNNAEIPSLFRDIFKNAFLPYRDPETLKLFLKCIDEFTYDHSERLGDAFEYLLAVLGSQGDAGQFRTPRHIIDFMVKLIDPQKEDSILDPACGTAGFLISAYKHILKVNSSNYDKNNDPHSFAAHDTPLEELVINGRKYPGDLLTPDQRAFLHQNIKGYDIAFEMVRLSLVNMYLHGFNTPQIYEYDTLTSTERWNEYANVILANPPFMTPKGGIRPHQKFTIQAKRSEVLFVDYMLEHLTNNGKAGIIVPEGIIFQNGKAYKQLRKLLVEENYLVGVISLPSGVFNPYSGVKTSILWIDKVLAKKTDKIIFLKINNDGFDLGAQRRPIEANDLPVAFANATAYKEAIVGKKNYAVPDKDVILVEKTKLAESGDYNLGGERYAIVSKHNLDLKHVKLGEIAEIVSGGTPDTKNKSYWDGEVNWATLVDLPAEDFISMISSTKRTITEQGLRNSSAKILPINTVIVSSRATIGRVGVNKTPIATNQGFKNLIVKNPAEVDYNYLAIVMRSLRDDLIVLGTGGTYKEVSKGAFESLSIPLPPISVQERIVAELDSYQKIIDGSRQVVDNWKPHIDIDPDWNVVKMKDVSFINPDSANPSELYSDWFMYIDIASIDNETNALSQVNRIPTSEAPSRARRIVKPKDVIISTVRPNLKAFYYFDQVPERAIVSTGFAVLRAKDHINPKYLYYMVLSDYLLNQMIASMGKGSYPSINQNDVRGLDIPMPDLQTQQAIVERIDNEQELISSARQLIALYELKIKKQIDKLWRAK